MRRIALSSTARVTPAARRPIVGTRRFLIRSLAAGLTIAAGVAALSRGVGAQAPATQARFYGVGVGPGRSVVRDATRVNGVIVAVGGSSTPIQTPGGVQTPTNAALWTIDGTNAPVRTMLPELQANAQNVLASAITPDAAYIAAQTRAPGRAVPSRGAYSGSVLVDSLSVAPYQVLTEGFNNFAATVSNDGSVLYGQVVVAGVTRGIRYDVGLSSSLLPLAPGFGQFSPAVRGASANGGALVGTAINGAYSGTTNGQAARYTPGSGTATIATPGTWSKALGMTPGGNATLLAGDSSYFPNGEVFIHTATPASLVGLGSPNAAYVPANIGGITGDGSVVVVTYGTAANFGQMTSWTSYVHNAHGWFHLASALRAAGVSLEALGWERLQATGISANGTLVVGTGLHNGSFEGFVADFDANFLRDFNPAAVAPTDTSIVGAWTLGDPSNPDGVVTFLADGTYFQIQASGFERGLYTWESPSGALRITTLQDTNGDEGLSDANGSDRLSVSVAGDTLIPVEAGCVSDCATPGTRVPLIPGSIVGAWGQGAGGAPDLSAVVVLTPSGKYFLAEDGDQATSPGGHDGHEVGHASWDPLTHAVTVLAPDPDGVDSNGDWGLSHPLGTLFMALSTDELQITASDNGGSNTLTRIVDPNSVKPVITSGSTVSGIATTPFSYAISATRALSFDATGLPPGLTVDTASGLISGAATTPGEFTATIYALNTLASTSTPLTITMAAPNTTAGADVTVTPAVPPGSNPIALQFASVTTPGETTVALVPTAAQVPPPSGFSVGGSATYLDIHTTAGFTGPVEVCVSYAGVNLNGSVPRLFHFVGTTWTDITTRVDQGTQTVCGNTTSFSPFAVFVSRTVRTGFFAPVSSAPGDVNSVKREAGVSFTFTVSENGVEKTSTSGLQFSLASVSCTLSGPETPLRFKGEDGLRFDRRTGRFSQRWEAPERPGCYVVRMTTASDHAFLQAIFKVR